MHYRVVLFQQYLRQFVLNFGKCLKEGEFVSETPPPPRTLYKELPTFENEMQRVKKHWRYWLRAIVGIPNIRIRFEKKGDLLFTYGTLLITNKPYCVYLETGLSLYNYSLGIGKNPIARLLVSLLAIQKNCHRLIFLSEAGKKSFFASLWYPKPVRDILAKKMEVVYPVPLPEIHPLPPKQFSGELKLLLAGAYYMKGGMEMIQAFERLRKQYSNCSLTILTPVHTMREEDVDYVRSIPGVTLLDATLGADEMRALYRDHHIFCLPTYRDGFGLVLIEALAYGMPLIITDQYATSEMLAEGENGFLFRNHPLQDYDPATYQILGRYYNPRDFYRDLFHFKTEGKFKPVEDFIYQSVEQFLLHPELVEQFSHRSLELYRQKFHPQVIGNQLENIFQSALKR